MTRAVEAGLLDEVGVELVPDDEHEPPRFFSWRTDKQLRGFAAEASFEVVDFRPVDIGQEYWFQSLTLRR